MSLSPLAITPSPNPRGEFGPRSSRSAKSPRFGHESAIPESDIPNNPPRTKESWIARIGRHFKRKQNFEKWIPAHFLPPIGEKADLSTYSFDRFAPPGVLTPYDHQQQDTIRELTRVLKARRMNGKHQQNDFSDETYTTLQNIAKNRYIRFKKGQAKAGDEGYAPTGGGIVDGNLHMIGQPRPRDTCKILWTPLTGEVADLRGYGKTLRRFLPRPPFWQSQFINLQLHTWKGTPSSLLQYAPHSDDGRHNTVYHGETRHLRQVDEDVREAFKMAYQATTVPEKLRYLAYGLQADLQVPQFCRGGPSITFPMLYAMAGDMGIHLPPLSQEHDPWMVASILTTEEFVAYFKNRLFTNPPQG